MKTRVAPASVRIPETPFIENIPVTGGYAVLFLVMPGLNSLNVGVAMLFGRLLQESIDRALADRNLPQPESPSTRQLIDTMCENALARLKDVAGEDHDEECHCAVGAEGLLASRRFFANVTERLYGGTLPSFVRHDDRFYFSFAVSDIDVGQRVVEQEIKRLGFYELAEIGAYSPEDKICRSFRHKKSGEPLTPHCVEVLQGAGLVPA